MYLPSMREDALPHPFDDAGQFVAAYMRMGLVENGIRCAEKMEQFHHPLHVAAFLGAGEKLAVRESACAAFAEAVVRFRIETLVAVEQGDIFFPFADLLTPLIDDGLDAVFQERERRKQSRRPATDDDHRTLGLMHILKHRWLVQRNRCILGHGLALLVRQNSKMHLQLSLTCIYTPFDHPPLLFGLMRLARGQY